VGQGKEKAGPVHTVAENELSTLDRRKLFERFVKDFHRLVTFNLHPSPPDSLPEHFGLNGICKVNKFRVSDIVRIEGKLTIDEIADCPFAQPRVDRSISPRAECGVEGEIPRIQLLPSLQLERDGLDQAP